MVNIGMMLQDTIAWNTGFWGSIIGWFDGFIANYGWTVIIVTIILKLLLSPLDFFQRKAGVKNAMQQAKLQPELEKIKVKYANNPEKCRQKLNEKQAEFMRSGQMKLGSTCGVMLVYMVVTLVVFLTLFTSMQSIANTRTVNSYIELENKYETVLADSTKTEEDAQNAVLELYNSGEVTQSWLWIDNIWKPDTRVSVVSSYDEFKNVAQNVAGSPYSFEEGKENYLSAEKYNKVMEKITQSTAGRWNGYYILIVLCGLVTFLTFQVTAMANNKRTGVKTQGKQAPNIGNIMKWALPIIMILITLFYSSAFALYILANSTFSLLSIPVYNAIINKTMKNKKDSNNSSNSDSSSDINVDYKINKITKVEE